MRNLIGDLKVHFSRKVFVLLASVALFATSYACKQNNNNTVPESQPGIKGDEVLVTVAKDNNITSVEPASFPLKKGKELGLTLLKAKLKKIEFKEGYELFRICVDGPTGKPITDIATHKFKTNTKIFLLSQRKSDKPILTSLNIDGKEITEIQDVIQAEETFKNRISIETTCSPNDASVEFSPVLKKGKWELESYGENTLKITVKKGSDEKIYTINILKRSQEPLKSLRFGPNIKRSEGRDGLKAGIDSVMGFAVPFSMKEVDVELEVDDGVTVEWKPITNGVPNIEDVPSTEAGKIKGKLRFSENYTSTDVFKPEYTLTLKQGGVSSDYRVQVARMVTDTLMYAGTNKGKPSVSKEDIDRILRHEENVELTIYGQELFIGFYSQSVKWKSFAIRAGDSDDIEFARYPNDPALSHILATGSTGIRFKKGETKIITIKIENNEVETITEDGRKVIVPKTGNLIREEFTFKVTHSNTTADVPARDISISSKNIVRTGPEILESLWSERDFPEFGANDPCEISLSFSAPVTKVMINDEEVASQGSGVNLAYKKTITGFANAPKDVSIVVTPQDTNLYHETKWKFKLVYLAGHPILVDYEINNVGEALPQAFKEKVETGANPLINVSGKALNLKLSSEAELEEVRIGAQTFSHAHIKKVATHGSDGATSYKYVLTYSVALADDQEKAIEATLVPKYKGEYATTVIKFRVKGDKTKEKIRPVFVQIANNSDLPKTFLDKLKEDQEANYPVYAIKKGNKARVFVRLSAYEKDFLCEKVEINGKDVKLDRDNSSSIVAYKADSDIDDISENPKNVQIKFIGKTNVADNVVWNFKIKNGGNIPKIPQRKLPIMKINGRGTRNDPLPGYFRDHLMDGSNPELEIYGKKVTFNLITDSLDIVREVKFEIDGEVKATQTFKQSGYFYVSNYDFELKDTESHPVKLIFIPQDAGDYSQSEFSFKLKSVSEKPEIDCVFAINYKARPSGHKDVLNLEYAELRVQAKKGDMKKVEIGLQGSEQDCTITHFTVEKNEISEASRVLQLDLNSSKTYIIKVTPEDAGKYATTICKYELQGTTVNSKNAEFSFDIKNNPMVTPEVTEWLPNITAKAPYELGATKGKIVAKTVSPRAKVKYRFVDAVTLEDITGSSEKEMTPDNKGVHTAEDIELFKDKPTKVKVWVVAEDAATTNDVKGLWYFTFNPTPIWWGYVNSKSLIDFRTKAYDEIKIDKTKVHNGKIYMVIAPWKDYRIDNSDLPQGQTNFVYVGQLGEYQKLYWTSIDVKDLLASSDPTTKQDVLIKLKSKDTLCSTYKLKVTKQ